MAKPIYLVAAALLAAAPAVRAADICEQQAQQQKASQSAGRDSGRPGEHNHPPRPKWWIDQKLRAELNITDQQSAAVEKIWAKSAPGLMDMRSKLEKLEDALTQLTKDDSVAEATVIAQIEQVENLRAEANKHRTIMIYRMNKVLTPDQRAKVRALYERTDTPRRPSTR